jgi:GNAT superfamily N-acetyltransferase
MIDTVQLAAEAWKLMAGRFPSSRIETGAGVTSCMGNVPLFFLNASILERPAESQDELRELLSKVARRSEGPHPWGVIAREDWLPAGWEPAIAEAGLAPILPMTDMQTSQLLPPARPAANLEIRRVDSDAIARDVAQLNAHAYHMPVELFECMCNMHLWHPDSFGYVGYANGKPVSCAAAFPVCGTVYVALVATLPEAQGKGYAATVVRHTVTQAQQALGIQATTLHATDMGFPVYRAMGYQPGPRVIFFGPAH